MAVLCGHGGDGDVKCRITWARTVAMVGQRSRAAHDEAMHMMDWMEVRRWWRASAVKVCGGDGEHGSTRRDCERERAERESENERGQWLHLPFLVLLA